VETITPAFLDAAKRQLQLAERAHGHTGASRRARLCGHRSGSHHRAIGRAPIIRRGAPAQ
jgi:hypothetical protein